MMRAPPLSYNALHEFSQVANSLQDLQNRDKCILGSASILPGTATIEAPAAVYQTVSTVSHLPARDVAPWLVGRLGQAWSHSLLRISTSSPAQFYPYSKIVSATLPTSRALPLKLVYSHDPYPYLPIVH